MYTSKMIQSTSDGIRRNQPLDIGLEVNTEVDIPGQELNPNIIRN
jgi:hypothetical protein